MIQRIKAISLLVVSALLFATPASSQDTTDTWRGLVVAPEHRCSTYNKKRDYPYPQSIEQDIVDGLGRVYGPYTDTCSASARETDIEHIVATSEAHDSGLCARDRATRARIATDLRDLTLASPRVNRHRKSGKDAAEWLPDRNRCWFAARVVEVRRAYGLTFDPRQATALERILARCDSTGMEPMTFTLDTAAAGAGNEETGSNHGLAVYDDNGSVRTARAVCIFGTYRTDAVQVMTENPYRLARDIRGVGFKNADGFAMELGIEKTTRSAPAG